MWANFMGQVLQHGGWILRVSVQKDRTWNLLVSKAWPWKLAWHHSYYILLVKESIFKERK